MPVKRSMSNEHLHHLWLIANDLARLSAMRTKQGYFTPEKWKEKTGVNPCNLPAKYISVTRSGLCIWTDEAERLYMAHCRQVTDNWRAIGASNI